jgi:nucleotide-binding universal stress UspA family protein
MMSKILVPIDGSENSEKGLRYACWLANKVGATITVLYVVNIPYTGESATLNVRSLIAAGRRILEEAKKIVKEENCAGAHFVLRQGTGNSGHEIVKFSKEGSFSVIVMSARGHTPLTHLLMGSVSDMVVHHASCPVIIVR